MHLKAEKMKNDNLKEDAKIVWVKTKIHKL